MDNGFSKNYFYCVIIVVFLDFFGVSLLIPLLPTYLRDAGLNSKSYGIMSSTYFASQLVGGFCIGFLSDNIKKRNILLISLCGSAISYAILGSSKNFTLLLFSRILVGLVKQTLTISTGIITDLTDNDRTTRSLMLSRISATISLAFIIGPTIGGILYKFDTRLPAYCSVFCFVIDAIFVYFFLPDLELKSAKDSIENEKNIETSTFFQRLKNIITYPLVGQMVVLRCLTIFIESSMSSSYVTDYFEIRYGIETYIRGFMSSATSITSLLVQAFVVGPMLTLFGDERKLMISSTIVIFICYTIEAMCHSFPIFLCLSLLPRIAASSLLGASSKGLLMNAIPREHTGKVLGILGLLSSAVGILSPLYGSQLFSAFGGANNLAVLCALHFAVLTFLMWIISPVIKVHSL